MDLETAFRNSVRRSVENFCKAIMDGGKPASQAKNKWKFENSADWHYGHFVGMMEASAINTYIEFFKEKPNTEQALDVQDIIEEESRALREYFKKNY